VYQALLIGFDDISGFLVGAVGGHLVTILLAAVLVVADGGVGVGVAFLAGNAVILVATAVRLLRAHGARQVFAPLLPVAVAMGAVAVAGWWTAATEPSMLLRAAAFIVTCAFAFLFLRPDERRWMLRPWQRSTSPRLQ
jgi:hypothetical protein